MDDSQIIDLYWQRNVQTIKVTASKYSAYCLKSGRRFSSTERLFHHNQ